MRSAATVFEGGGARDMEPGGTNDPCAARELGGDSTEDAATLLRRSDAPQPAPGEAHGDSDALTLHRPADAAQPRPGGGLGARTAYERETGNHRESDDESAQHAGTVPLSGSCGQRGATGSSRYDGHRLER